MKNFKFLWIVFLLGAGCTTPKNTTSDSDRNIASSAQMEMEMEMQNQESAKFIKIQKGTFMMGNPRISGGGLGSNYRDQVQVTLTKDFEIQSTEVTQLQWWKVMGTNPSHFSKVQFCPESHRKERRVEICPLLPVESVTWSDANKFIAKLNSLDKDFQYRLPTEAEWEYSARAGTTTLYFFGNEVDQLDNYAWSYRGPHGSHPVATKKPNPWGLFDILGNVSEWVSDFFGDLPKTPQIDPVGPSKGSEYVLRGGSATGGATGLRSGDRSAAYYEAKYENVGFRLVRTSK